MDYGFSNFQKNSIIRFLALDKYNYIKEYIYKCDISKDIEYQTKFNAFYRVRRDEKWRNIFYSYFEEIKNNKNISFDEILDYIYKKTGNIEASFCSKLLSTINPKMPICDQYVLKNLNLEVKGNTKEERLENTKKNYKKIVEIENNKLKELNIQKAVQDLLEQKHISHSRKSDYLLTNKLYCGMCGAKMTGAVAKKKYHYYKCVNSKGALKTCSKEKVDREYIEDLVVKETRNMLTKENIRIIADMVIEFIEKDKDLSEIKKLQKSLKKCEQEIESLLIAVRQATTDNVRNLLINELEKAQEQQKGLKAQLSFEEANNMPVTASQVRFYLTELKKGNINTKKYRRLLIDTFIYKIYLYDEKMVITYTTQDSSNIRLPDRNLMLSSLEGTIAPPIC